MADLAIKQGVQSPIVMELNPIQSEVKLECSQYVDANPPPFTFTWKYNGIASTETSKELVLSSQTNGKVEIAECVATNGLCKYMSINYCYD